jgi:hypothetical protein
MPSPDHLVAVMTVALAVAVPPTGLAQRAAASLTGTVVSQEAGDPVSGAHVRLQGSGITAVTDAAGRFELGGLAPGEHVVEIHRDGFAPTVIPVSLREGQRLAIPEGVLRLEWEPSGFAERRAKRRGVFVERDQIEAWQARTVTDVLRHVPGVRVGPSPNRQRAGFDPQALAIRMVRGAPGCSPLVYLDGAFLGSTSEFDLDGTVTAAELVAVEVYRGITEVPPLFDVAGGAQCGVVALWTQEE